MTLTPKNPPRLLALCGRPKSGKTEVQRLLEKHYGYAPVDDGFPMRDFAMRHLGLTHDQVYTQEGKASRVEVAGVNWQVRDILGQLGNHLEALFGADGIPFMATANLEPGKLYSFGCVRREQGAFYKRMGGLVIGIRRPGIEPSPFEFDRFNEELVDYWIDNDGDLEALSRKIDALMFALAGIQQAA